MRAEYVDHMGSDLTVVNAARVSFDKHVDVFSERDEKLLKYLARHGHFTPYTHPQITVRETVPEVSRRYVSDDPEFFIPEEWRASAENVKQGSSSDAVEEPWLTEAVEAHHEMSLSLYKKLMESGVCNEQARMVLPQSMYTSYYVTGSLSAWARAYILRAEKTAQKEIQELAHIWASILVPLFPASWAALTEGK
jgi:thymidylate synthase (FAD)